MSFILTAAVLVGKPILKSVGKELLGLWIESDWAKEAIVEGADGWAIRLYAKLPGGDRRAELGRAFDAIAAAQPAELDALVAEVTDEAVAETANVARAASPSPSDTRARLQANLRLATERIRSAARSDVLDHAGRPTIPRSLIPRDAAELLRFLPILPPSANQTGDTLYPVGGWNWKPLRLGAPSAHQPGDTLYPHAAHLTLVRLLGVGDFGEVWETQNNNRRSEPHMAVKIFTHPDAARFIELENSNMALIARMMENDPHPGIVPILQNHLHSRPPALAYELVQGRELSWLVQAWHDGSQGRSGPQPDQAARLLLRIADIVAHFHRHGIIHRDLKPANILIDTATQLPRIIGFGLSQAQASSEAGPKAAQCHSLASVTALKGSGTVGYASPEQFDSNVPADVRDDVHALGVIGYELLTAELPRGGMSRAMERKLIAGGVPEGLVDMLAQCLEQKRDDRLESAQALVVGLIELCGPLDETNESHEASWNRSEAEIASGTLPEGRAQRGNAVASESATPLSSKPHAPAHSSTSSPLTPKPSAPQQPRPTQPAPPTTTPTPPKTAVSPMPLASLPPHSTTLPSQAIVPTQYPRMRELRESYIAARGSGISKTQARREFAPFSRLLNSLLASSTGFPESLLNEPPTMDISCLRQLFHSNDISEEQKNSLLLFYSTLLASELRQEKPQSFKWPSTAIMPAGQAFSQIHFHYTDGLLKFMGYTVGVSGLPKLMRWGILDFVYNESVPQVQSKEYMTEWAAPRSSGRLRKLAYSLAAFCRNALRRHDAGIADMSVACEDWNADLDYLYRIYYVGFYDFQWPQK